VSEQHIDSIMHGATIEVVNAQQAKPCSLLDQYQNFGRTYCHHMPYPKFTTSHTIRSYYWYLENVICQFIRYFRIKT